MSDTIIYIIIAAIVGIIVGFILAYLALKSKDKDRLEDELTKTRRELANQRRMLNDYFNSSNALFEQLENSYQAYAHHMSEQSKKIVPQLGNIFEISAHPAPQTAPTKPVTPEKITETKLEDIPDKSTPKSE